MDDPTPFDITAIGRTETFTRLSRERSALGGTLAVAMAAVYFAFIFTVAFAPAELGLPIYDGAVVSVGVVAGVAIMTLALALTIVYVLYASRRIDPMVNSLKGASR
jgi:uncharacterized membrane protein (DUF485 family)